MDSWVVLIEKNKKSSVMLATETFVGLGLLHIYHDECLLNAQ